jgi:hypothetical protein
MHATGFRNVVTIGGSKVNRRSVIGGDGVVPAFRTRMTKVAVPPMRTPRVRLM